ncbi:hypothetical protein ACS0TY_008917 [Phlomoides rotata]
MMYDLYREHARICGFSVRKATSRYSKGNKQIPIELGKMFVCSCNGEKTQCSDDSSTSSTKKKRSTNITRTNCKAMMRVNRNREGVFFVWHDLLLLSSRLFFFFCVARFLIYLIARFI